VKKAGFPTARALSAFVNTFFIISIIVFLLSVIAIVYSSITYPNWENIIIYLLFLTAFFIALITMIKLRQIIRTILEGEPFTLENVHNFRTIGILSLAIGAINFIFTLVSIIKDRQLVIFGLGEGGIILNIGLFLFIFFGLFALVLAEIFKLSYQIKEENKLTI